MTQTALTERPPSTAIDPATVERVLIHGDLKQLTPAQKVSYYKAVCESVGLNPLTQPFQYIVLNGKEVLYAKRDATDQLRSLHNISVEVKAREVIEDCYVVTAGAHTLTGRADESTGVVSIGGLKGEARANAMMKAETKAKRRVTLSICGLGMLDETEVDSIREADATPMTHTIQAPRRIASTEAAPDDVNVQTGEVASEVAGLRVTKVDPRSGKTTTGKPYTLYIVHFSDGRQGSTFDEKTALFAEQCRDNHAAVDRVLEPGKRDGTFNLTELTLSQPSILEPPQ